MTARKTSPPGEEHYKVRVVVDGALLHLASVTEPVLETGWVGEDHRVIGVTAEWQDDPDHGDAYGFIHWPAITGITWRYTGGTT